jgi:cytidine deaminase
MHDEIQKLLISKACAARDRAYARYSRFAVGAALLTDDEQLIPGCNVENASYGLTSCAERNAVFSAVALGQQRFRAIAIASSGGVAPCGACRQVLFEFAPDLPILLIDTLRPGEIVESNLNQLLPRPFSL